MRWGLEISYHWYSSIITPTFFVFLICKSKILDELMEGIASLSLGIQCLSRADLPKFVKWITTHKKTFPYERSQNFEFNIMANNLHKNESAWKPLHLAWKLNWRLNDAKPKMKPVKNVDIEVQSKWNSFNKIQKSRLVRTEYYMYT